MNDRVSFNEIKFQFRIRNDELASHSKLLERNRSESGGVLWTKSNFNFSFDFETLDSSDELALHSNLFDQNQAESGATFAKSTNDSLSNIARIE